MLISKKRLQCFQASQTPQFIAHDLQDWCFHRDDSIPVVWSCRSLPKYQASTWTRKKWAFSCCPTWPSYKERRGRSFYQKLWLYARLVQEHFLVPDCQTNTGGCKPCATKLEYSCSKSQSFPFQVLNPSAKTCRLTSRAQWFQLKHEFQLSA